MRSGGFWFINQRARVNSFGKLIMFPAWRNACFQSDFGLMGTAFCLDRLNPNMIFMVHNLVDVGQIARKFRRAATAAGWGEDPIGTVPRCVIVLS
jgi:hypothetical protein